MSDQTRFSSYERHQQLQRLFPDATILVRRRNFFEAYGDSAAALSRFAGAPLVAVEVGFGQTVPASAVSVKNVDSAVKKLVEAGKTVVVAQRVGRDDE